VYFYIENQKTVYALIRGFELAKKDSGVEGLYLGASNSSVYLFIASPSHTAIFDSLLSIQMNEEEF